MEFAHRHNIVSKIVVFDGIDEAPAAYAAMRDGEYRVVIKMTDDNDMVKKTNGNDETADGNSVIKTADNNDVIKAANNNNVIKTANGSDRNQDG